jgi:beta-glucosidase
VYAKEYVTAIQNNPYTLPYKQAACPKHFLGYSDPRSGWDRTPAYIPDQRLYEFFVPAFKAAIDAGAKTVMINSGEINGVPVHSSYKILTELLRNQLGFDGVAMTDWEDVIRLHTWHKTAESVKEAVYQSVMAGIDVSLTPQDPGFATYLKELVKEGRIPDERIDLSVKRVLRLKFNLGLFDENRFPSIDRIERINSTENQTMCLNATRESIVLMKNDNTLPLGRNKKILVVGKFAQMKRALTGGWTYVWIPSSDNIYPDDMQTLYEALILEFGEENIDFCDFEEELDDKAKNADILLLTIGHEPYAELLGNTTDMHLDREQEEMANKVLANGKPTVMVIIEGRPVLLTEIYDRCNSVIWAGLPCFYGGRAIAEVISGKVIPSGKLPFSYPAYPLHFSPYNRKPTDTLVYSPSLNGRISLADFGHGLSYTSFKYNSLVLSDSIISPDQKIIAKVTVTNIGDYKGKETVLWYINDNYASITRPIKELVYFEKKELFPGETYEFSFEIEPYRDLTFPNEKGNTILEPGGFMLQVGELSKTFQLVENKDK